MLIFYSFDLVIKLFKSTNINIYIIKLVKEKQPLYKLFYAFSPVKLNTLKAYIKNHLKTEFIWLSRSLLSTPIFFNKKSDDSLCLCINYQSLNNMIMKNWYLFLLIDKTLDQLDWAK